MPTTATLTWNPNTESDLAGYNVYREINTGGFQKLNTTLVPKGTQTYVDTPLPIIDGDLIYNITAVDTSGNESLHSANVDKQVNMVPPSAPSGLAVVLS